MSAAAEDPERAFAAALAAAFPAGPPPRLGLAVSGGGDSTALALLAARWAAGRGVQLFAVTVDHRLRPASAAEAVAAGAFCAGLGIEHATLPWEAPEGRGNLQDRARRARAGLIAGWAAARGIGHVATGHTLDDQAETVLMRLARGSGVDGLSAMAPARREGALVWLRPLLSIRREALRRLLAVEGIPWAEDPSNADPRFARVRARGALAALAPLGITAEGLAATAARMQRARRALEQETAALARAAARVERGDVVIALEALRAAPEEIALRLVAHALAWVGGEAYRPRHAALLRLFAAALAGRGGTLHGCCASVSGGALRIAREWRAVRGLVAAPGALWDGRWRIEGPFAPGDRIAALGPEGLGLLREALCGAGAGVPRLPRASLLAAPAVWRGGRPVALPHAGLGEGWAVSRVPGPGDFLAALMRD